MQTNNISFGVSFFANHAIIKLNTKLEDSAITELASQYPALIFTELSGKREGYTNISGIIPENDISRCMLHIKYACHASKVARMQAELDGLESIMCSYDAHVEDHPLHQL